MYFSNISLDHIQWNDTACGVQNFRNDDLTLTQVPVTIWRHYTTVNHHDHWSWQWLVAFCPAINFIEIKNKPGTHNSYLLQWRHNGHDGLSNYQPYGCLLNRLYKCRSKKTSGLCVGNSPGTGEFPAQRASDAENVSIWWRHHVQWKLC